MGKVIAGTLAAFAGLVLVMVGGWWLHWWFVQADTNNAAHVNRSSFGFQQTLRDEVTQHLGDVADISTQIIENPAEAAQLKAQRTAIVNIVCGEANQVTGDPLPADQASFVAQNCLNGSVSPESIYAQK